jgi:hypothetical protein
VFLYNLFYILGGDTVSSSNYGEMKLNGRMERVYFINQNHRGNNFQWTFRTQDRQTSILVNVDSSELLYGELNVIEGYIKIIKNGQELIIAVKGEYGC